MTDLNTRTYEYSGDLTIAQQLTEAERKLAVALRTIEELKHPKMPTPHSDGHARLLAATREAYGPRKGRRV